MKFAVKWAHLKIKSSLSEVNQTQKDKILCTHSQVGIRSKV